MNRLDKLVMPFTNVINSFYARQSSSKTKAAFQARARAGMFIGSRAPFGYIKDPNDNHHLIVDPPAADVVRDIFRMFADGVGYVRMSKLLRECGVLNPQAYFNRNNPGYYQSEYWRQPHDWYASSIHAISYNALSQLVLEVDAHILNELIDRIVVHEKELGPDGIKHQRVDIHYKFIGYVDTK